MPALHKGKMELKLGTSRVGYGWGLVSLVHDPLAVGCDPEKHLRSGSSDYRVMASEHRGMVSYPRVMASDHRARALDGQHPNQSRTRPLKNLEGPHHEKQRYDRNSRGCKS